MALEDLLTSINEQEVHSKVASSLLHVAREADKIAPVCAIVLLLDMAIILSDIAFESTW